MPIAVVRAMLPAIVQLSRPATSEKAGKMMWSEMVNANCRRYRTRAMASIGRLRAYCRRFDRVGSISSPSFLTVNPLRITTPPQSVSDG